MKKVLSLTLKLVAIILAIMFIGFGVLLYRLISDKSGPYVETPYLIGGLILIGSLLIVLWILSNSLNWSHFLFGASFYSIVVAGYFAFTPVVSVDFLLQSTNSGNIFTFYTDKTFEFIKQSNDFQKMTVLYQRHLVLVILLILASIVLFFIGKKVGNISANTMNE